MNYYLLVIIYPNNRESIHLLKAENAGQAEDKAEAFHNSLPNSLGWYFQMTIE